MTEFTVTWTRKLRPYDLLTGRNHVDAIVQDELYPYLDPATISAINQYGISAYDTDLHFESLFKYKRTIKEENIISERIRSCPYISTALTLVEQDLACLGNTNLIPSNHIDEVEYNATSSAGFGYLGKKSDNYLTARRRASSALYHFQRFKDDYRFTPDMAFARCQLSTLIKPKIRHVWGRAFHNILIEGLLVQNLLKKVLLTETPLYIGRNIFKRMPFDIRKLFLLPTFAYCLDFSSFDAKVNNVLVEYAFNIIQKLLNFQSAWEYNIFLYVKELFMKVPLVMPTGDLYLVTTGIPSGSLLTQLIGSIINLILMRAFQIKFFDAGVPTAIMGDDSIFVSPISIDINDIVSFFAHYGMTLNQDKSVITSSISEVYFLGHNFYGSRITKEEFITLVYSVFTEYLDLTPSYTISRIASLLVDTGFNSWTLFRIFNNLLVKHDVNWQSEILRPASIHPPFVTLFSLS